MIPNESSSEKVDASANEPQKIVLIVDGFRASRQYPRAFNAEGASCVSIISSGDIAKHLGQINSQDYIESILFDGDLDALVQKLKAKYNLPGQMEIVGVMPGQDCGTELANQLANKLTPHRANDLAKSEAHYNKEAMIELLQKQGLRTAKQHKAKDLATLFSWIENLPAEEKYPNKPIVLKPLESAGSNGVFVCNSTEEVERAYSYIMEKPNWIGEQNTEVLAQTYLGGDEYAVNGVVMEDGAICFTDVWKYKKKIIDGRPVYKYDMAIDCSSTAQEADSAKKELLTYAENAIKTLGIRTLFHLEIKQDPEKGSALVEAAARSYGAWNGPIYKEIWGVNPVETVVLSYRDPKKCKAIADKKFPELRQYAIQADFYSTKSGIITGLPFNPVTMKEAYSCIREIHLNYKVGDEVALTEDLKSELGSALLVGSLEEILEIYNLLEDLSNSRLVTVPVQNTNEAGWKKDEKPVNLSSLNAATINNFNPQSPNGKGSRMTPPQEETSNTSDPTFKQPTSFY